MIGIIGGTGTDSLKDNYPIIREENISTKYNLQTDYFRAYNFNTRR